MRFVQLGEGVSWVWFGGVERMGGRMRLEGRGLLPREVGGDLRVGREVEAGGDDEGDAGGEGGGEDGGDGVKKRDRV